MNAIRSHHRGRAGNVLLWLGAIMLLAATTTTAAFAKDVEARKQGAAKRAAEIIGGAGSESFSVDMIMVNDGEKMTIRRIVDGPRSRMEVNAEGQPVVMIQLGDEAGTMYTLMPKEKRGIKQSNALARQMMQPTEEEEPQPQDSCVVEYLGEEEIDGIKTEKYRATSSSGSGLMWVDAKTQQPVRMKAEEAQVDFRNYAFGPQPDELFMPPKGYEIMDMDEMMKSMPKGGLGGGMMAGGMKGAMRGMAGGMAGGMMGGMGGSLGASVGGAMGGPIGAMVGQFVGSKVGQKIGQGAANAVIGN